MKKLAISTINATSIPNFSSLQEADWIPSAGINISRTQKDLAISNAGGGGVGGGHNAVDTRTP